MRKLNKTIFAKTIEDGWASKVKFNTLPNE
jgi:hypothetical protein